MSRAKFKVVMDMTEMNRAIEKVEGMPRRIMAHLRKRAIPRATQMLRDAWYMEVPMGNDADRAKQSRKHKAKWAGVIDVVSSINHHVRDWDRVNSSLWVGPELMNRNGTSPGNKLFFDYMGTTNRRMSFWSGPEGGPSRYRARTKTKDWVAKRINDTMTPQVISMMMQELQVGFTQEMRQT